MLFDGFLEFSLVEKLRISLPLVMESMNCFTEAIVEMYEAEWLRRPNEAELKKIEARYRELGVPGCIDCVDCARWSWDEFSIE